MLNETKLVGYKLDFILEIFQRISNMKNIFYLFRYELAQTELHKGKYMLTEDDLDQQHNVLMNQKMEDFTTRKAKDDKYVQSKMVFSYQKIVVNALIYIYNLR